MNKIDLLTLLRRRRVVTVDDAAVALGIERATASMRLLRLFRQSLVHRWTEADHGCLLYAVSERGLDRLNYLLGVEPPDANLRPNRKGGSTDMRRAKTHTGNFFCSECCIEYDLVNETSLKCPDCGSPLAAGTLDSMWDDKEE